MPVLAGAVAPGVCGRHRAARWRHGTPNACPCAPFDAPPSARAASMRELLTVRGGTLVPRLAESIWQQPCGCASHPCPGCRERQGCSAPTRGCWQPPVLFGGTQGKILNDVAPHWLAAARTWQPVRAFVVVIGTDRSVRAHMHVCARACACGPAASAVHTHGT